MNILGINGLGVSPSASLLIEGKIAAMAEEERFNRIKGAFGMMPALSSRYCLEEAGISLDEVDLIAFSWDAGKYRFRMPLFMALRAASRRGLTRGSAGSAASQLFKYSPGAVKQEVAVMFRSAGIRGDIPEIQFISHHLSHAASTYYTSGYGSSGVLVIDGSGEERAVSVYTGRGLKLGLKRVIRIPDSLGWFYQSITDLLGFKPNLQEGKTMALAAYGKENPRVMEKIRKVIKVTDKGYTHNARYSFFGKHTLKEVASDELAELLGVVRYRGEPIEDIHRDIAFAAQSELERAVSALTASEFCGTGFSGRLSLSGGVALNCKMNGLLAARDEVNEIHVPPFAGDAGAALGAAMAVSVQKGEDPRFRITHPYYGPGYGDREILRAAEKSGFTCIREKDPSAKAARLLSDGYILAWFQGRMETGPRALGARSILAPPFDKRITEIINSKIKNRELWRPFAPSILRERAGEYIEYPGDAPFMTVAVKARPGAVKRIPAVIHIDHTTRPHLVERDASPDYWRLLKEFERLTGEGVILNTSFNSHREPLVCSPGDAIRTFSETGLEYMLIGKYFISKNRDRCRGARDSVS